LACFSAACDSGSAAKRIRRDDVIVMDRIGFR
jgi:hypothetical protein